MKKRFLATLLAVALGSTTLLGGCSSGGGSAAKGGKSGAPVKLVYYTIGTAGSDLDKVMAEANKTIQSKINCTVQMNYIDYGDYDSKMSAIINSGENYDLTFTTSNDQYLTNVKKGAFAPLDTLLKKDGKGILKQMDSRFWTGVKVNGKIYAIPTDKEIATPYYFVYNKALVQKYHIDISKIKTLQDLEPAFKTIKDGESANGWTPYMLGKGFIYPIGYAFLISSTIPVCIDEHDSSAKVLNFYDEQKTVDAINTMRKYYQEGYINKDANTVQSLPNDPKSFFTMNLAGPDADAAFSIGATYPKVTQLVEDPPVITTYSTQGAMVAINANSRHKDEAVQFVNLCHTDVDLINTLYNGIKGTHWKLDQNNQVEYISPAHQNYEPPTYTLGSNVLMTPTQGSPSTWGADYRAFNKEAKASPILGFNPDTTSITTQIAAITNVTAKYSDSLWVGASDPATVLPKFKAELKQAGIDTVISTLQSQLNKFRKTQK